MVSSLDCSAMLVWSDGQEMNTREIIAIAESEV